MRIKRFRREAAAYIMLRRLGYSISVLSAVFGRSTSMIARILHKNLALSDLRKLPARVRALAHRSQMVDLRIRARSWEDFIFGQGEKPP